MGWPDPVDFQHVAHDFSLYGLIGYPLSHSFSPRFFQEKFEREGLNNCAYLAFPFENLDTGWDFLTRNFPHLKGLNVTIPYKERIRIKLDAFSKEAREVGAVNCIKREKGQWRGYNTDVYGFETSLLNLFEMHGLELPRAALVLGRGGASKAVCYVLKKLAIPWQIVSRNPEAGALAYDEISRELLANIPLIINTTPLGMGTLKDSYPQLPYDALSSHHILYDLIYNPEKTVFLRRGLQAGSIIKNGLEMLYLQAEKSWEIWKT